MLRLLLEPPSLRCCRNYCRLRPRRAQRPSGPSRRDLDDFGDELVAFELVQSHIARERPLAKPSELFAIVAREAGPDEADDSTDARSAPGLKL